MIQSVAVAGASGFVGRLLVDRLSLAGHKVFALSRSRPSSLPQDATWREADLFSAHSTLDVLDGADVAIYLVHSMLPSTTLFQGDFHDTDLLLADNFALACRARGVRRIVYLGGLVPEGHISQHLDSRREVEDVLRASGVPVTVLRAGMIVGPGGSSFEILRSLVRRLPFMVLPAWTQRRTQTVFIDDVIEVLSAAVSGPEFEGKTLDLVNGESLRYEALLRQMADVLGLKRRMFPVPIQSTGFSKLWVSLFGRTSYALVSPLIDSLLCDLPDSRPEPAIASRVRFKTFKMMAIEALKRGEGESSPTTSALWFRRRRLRTVRSIQRLPAVPSHDCHWISTEYMRWLPGALASLVRVISAPESGRVEFKLRGIPWALLQLQYIRGSFDEDRKKFHIVGGLLTATRDTGWLEFRQVENRRYTLAAIHEFVPRLPWPIYLMTQAPLHAWVMKRFGDHLTRRISA